MAIFLVSQINFLISMRIYRAPITFFKALGQSVYVTAYVYAHWVPVITVSFCQILFGRQVSTWHRTEHAGVAEKVFK